MQAAGPRNGQHGSATAKFGRLGIPDWLPCGTILLLALLFGGGTRQGLLSDTLVQLLSLPLLAAALLRVPEIGRDVHRRTAAVILAAIVLLPILQLAPLPPAIWTALPGRSPFAADYSAADIELPWLPISLDPATTWRSATGLVPPTAVFLSALFLGRRSRRALSLGLIVFGFASVLFGLAQLAQGSDSPLRFYRVTNPGDTVGFFANRNHFGALLYTLVPFTAAWAVGLAADRRREIIVAIVLCLLVFVSLLLGLGMSRSRAALVLAMLATLASLVLAGAGSGATSNKRTGAAPPPLRRPRGNRLDGAVRLDRDHPTPRIRCRRGLSMGVCRCDTAGRTRLPSLRLGLRHVRIDLQDV